MRWIAVILLVGVFTRHNTALWLASGSSLSPQAVFYILGGVWEIVLCGVLAAILLAAERTLWRYLALVAVTVGIAEASQMSVCRLAISDIARLAPDQNLCDYLTGLPVGATLTALYLLAIAYGVGKYLRARRA